MTRGRPKNEFPEEKECRRCGDVKPIDEFYVKRTKKGTERPSSYCKECNKLNNKEYARDQRGTPAWNDIPKTPGEYNDNEEKQMTFEFLTSIGWKYNKETNSFYKPGLREKDNIWTILKKHQPKPIVYDIPEHTPGFPLSKEMKKVIKKLLEQGESVPDISKMCNVSTTIIYTIRKTIPKPKKRKWR